MLLIFLVSFFLTDLLGEADARELVLALLLVRFLGDGNARKSSFLFKDCTLGSTFAAALAFAIFLVAFLLERAVEPELVLARLLGDSKASDLLGDETDAFELVLALELVLARFFLGDCTFAAAFALAVT